MVVFGGRAVEELGGGVGCDSVNCVPESWSETGTKFENETGAVSSWKRRQSKA